MMRKRNYPPAPGVRRASKRAHSAIDRMLVSLHRLLDQVEGVELTKRFLITALQNNDPASRCAQSGGGNQTRNAAADDAYGAFRSERSVVPRSEVMNHANLDEIGAARARSRLSVILDSIRGPIHKLVGQARGVVNRELSEIRRGQRQPRCSTRCSGRPCWSDWALRPSGCAGPRNPG